MQCKIKLLFHVFCCILVLLSNSQLPEISIQHTFTLSLENKRHYFKIEQIELLMPRVRTELKSA